MAESVDESPLLVVYRHPQLNDLQAEKIREFARAEAGGKYNYMGISSRRLIQLPEKYVNCRLSRGLFAICT